MTLPAWGKFDKESQQHHHLAHHSMDVAAVFQHLLSLPVFRERAQTAFQIPLSPTVVSRLGALVFLHDIGKLHPGFQAKGWSEGLWPYPKHGHVTESVSFILQAFERSDHPFFDLVSLLANWGSGVESLLQASFSHHGKPLPPNVAAEHMDWDRPSAPHYCWRSEATDMATALRRWFPDAFEEDSALPSNPRFIHFFAGLAALADWVGSYREVFQFQRELDLNYDSEAKSRAKSVMSKIGLDTRGFQIRRPIKFVDVAGFQQPNPAQSVVGKTPLEETLVILEAETGSGKTEAALWRFAQLFAADRVDGLYFAVPTRAAARQLHNRINDSLQRLFGACAPEAVLAVPGALKAGRATGRQLPNWNVLWEDRKHADPARWSAEHATRFLASTVAVGTVDQAMLAGLMVKHAHLRSSALSKNLLVIDEVHASDAYMTRVLTNLLGSHRKTGGYAMLMSATLGSQARIRWTGESSPTLEEAKSTPYPAVWSSGVSHPEIPDGKSRTKTVELSLDGMESGRAAGLALAAAERGAKVLVIRNTVSRAVETWEDVIRSGGENQLLQVAGCPAIHHGRFAAEDREELDHAVEASLSTRKDRPPGGMIVIGTQTLEQSLDIDADLLLTDLCPIDVLLQRIGRLHRHELPRPEGFGSPKCVVLTPEQGLDRLANPPAFDNGLGGWLESGALNGIYRDLVILELTQRLVSQYPTWTIPDMNRLLVEMATHRECRYQLLEEKGEAWKRYDRQHGGAEAAEAQMARLSWLNRETPYEEQIFPNDDEQIFTRLGEEGVIISFDNAPTGPFGRPVTKLSLPARWSKGVTAEDIKDLDVTPAEEGFDIALGARSFAYRRSGLALKKMAQGLFT